MKEKKVLGTLGWFPSLLPIPHPPPRLGSWGSYLLCLQLGSWGAKEV